MTHPTKRPEIELTAVVRSNGTIPYLYSAYVFEGAKRIYSCTHHHGERGGNGYRKALDCAERMLRKEQRRRAEVNRAIGIGTDLTALTAKQQAVVARFRRLVKDAERVGLKVVADSGAIGVRFLTASEYGDGSDLTERGELIKVHDACGADAPKYSGDACNSAYT